MNERFHLSLPEEEYETVGGYVFGTLGRVAEVGDEVVIPQGILRVVAMDGRRIARLAYAPQLGGGALPRASLSGQASDDPSGRNPRSLL